MKKQKKQGKSEPIKIDGILDEKYAPVEEWSAAEEKYRDLPLNDGEYTKIIVKSTGIGICIVAKFDNSLRSHPYLDGVKFRTKLKNVTPLEIDERKKEQEKFL